MSPRLAPPRSQRIEIFSPGKSPGITSVWLLRGASGLKYPSRRPVQEKRPAGSSAEPAD